MAYKDARGIWRHDGFPCGKARPDRCPNCGSDDLVYGVMFDDEIDAVLLDEFDQSVLCYKEQRDLLERFSFTPEYAYCGECGESQAYGPDYYYNPDTNNYDLTRPLSWEEIRRAELQAEREAAEAAGQLPLFR